MPDTPPAANGASASADAGNSLAACQAINPFAPQSWGTYADGSAVHNQFKSGTLAADGSVALYCVSSDTVIPVPASQQFCPQPPHPKRATGYIPGAPNNGSDGVVLCDPAHQTTKQIKAICATGKDPGIGVNNTP